MASNERFNITLNFDANVKKAKASILDLQNSLSKISLNSLDTSKNVSQLKEASEAARELQMHLANAYNVNTGKLDLSKLNNSLQSSKSNLSVLAARLTQIGPEGQKAFVQLAQSIADADRNTLTLNSRISKMMLTLGNTVRWQIASAAVNQVVGAVQTTVGYAEDLNKSLNSIRIVSGQSADQMAKFAIQANKAAKALSATTLDYTDAALIYYQQGLAEEEVKARTEVTIKMANAAGESAKIVSDQLTAVWNNFYDGSKSLEYYADVMTKLGAATASSTDEISEGLEKFAAVAGTIGLSYEYATAALTTITSNTRESANVVGTALKTIFSRIQDLDLGNTLDDGTTLGTYSQALAKIGVNVLDVQGQLIKMDDILDQIAAKWDTLAKAQQVSLAQSVAGVRQYNQLVALMDNWNKTDADSMISNLGYIDAAEGTLTEQANIFAESWEGAANQVKASMQALYSDIIDDKFFIKLLNYLSEGIDSVDALIDGMGGIKPILIGIVGYIASAMSSQISPMLQSVRNGLEIVFTGKSKSGQRMADEANRAFDEVLAKGGLSKEDEQSLRAARQLNEVKKKYGEIESELTPVEKIRYETEISILQAQQDQIKVLMEQEDSLAKELETRKEITQKLEEERITKEKTNKLDKQALADAQKIKANQKANEIAAESRLNNLNSNTPFRYDIEKAKKSNKLTINQQETNLEEQAHAARVAYATAQAGGGDVQAAKQVVNEADKALREFKNSTVKELEDFIAELTNSYSAVQMGKTASDISLSSSKSAQDLKLQLESLKTDLSTKTAREVEADVLKLKENLEQSTFNLIDFEGIYAKISTAGKNNKKTGTGGMSEAIDELIGILDNASVKVDDFETVLKQFGQSGFVSSWKSHLKAIATAERELETATKAVEKAEVKVAEARKKETKSATELQEAQKELTEALKNQKDAQEKLTAAENKVHTSQKKVNDTVKGFDPKPVMSGAQAFGKLVGSLGQITMSISSFKSAISALNNEDLNGFEKFLTVIPSLSIAIPTTVKGFRELKDSLDGGIDVLILLTQKYSELAVAQGLVNTGITKEAAVLTINAMVKRGYLDESKKEEALKGLLAISTANLTNEEKKEAIQKVLMNLMSKEQQKNFIRENSLIVEQTVLTKILQAVQKGLTGGFLSATLTIAGLAAVVAVLGVAIKKLKKLWDDHQAQKPENQLKAAKEEAKELASALSEAQTELENVKSAFEGIDLAVEVFAKATKGTKEWTEALKDNNNQVIQLLEQYPELASWVDEETGLSAIGTDSDGRLFIRDFAKERLEEQKENAYENIQISNFFKNKEVRDLEEAVLEDNASKAFDGHQTEHTRNILKAAYNKSLETGVFSGEKFKEEVIDAFGGNPNNWEDTYLTEAQNYYELNKQLEEKQQANAAIDKTSGTALLTSLFAGEEGINAKAASYVDLDSKTYQDLLDDEKNNVETNIEGSWAKLGLGVGTLNSEGEMEYTDANGEKQTMTSDEIAEQLVAGEIKERKGSEMAEVSKVLDTLTEDEQAVLDAVNSGSVGNLSLDQLNEAESIYANMSQEAKDLVESQGKEELNWQALIDNFDYEAYWKKQADAAKAYAESANNIVSTLASGDELDEEQSLELDNLISKYGYLNELKEKGGHEYLQALRDIGQVEEQNHLEALQHTREQLNAQKENLQRDIAKALRAGNADVAEDLQNQLEIVLDKISENDYSIKVAVQADLESDIDSALQIASGYDTIAGYLEDGLNISVEKAKQIMADGNGAMLTSCKMTTDGMLQLDQSVVDNFIAGKQAEFETAKEAEIKKLEAKRIIYQEALTILENEKDAFSANQDTMSDEQKINAIQQIAVKQAESIAKENSIEDVTEANAEGSQATITMGEQVATAWVDYLNQIGNAANNTNLAIANIGNGDYTFESYKYSGGKYGIYQYKTEEERQAAISESSSGITKENSVVIGDSSIDSVTLEAIYQYVNETGGSVSEAIDDLYNASKKSYEDRINSLRNNIGSIDMAIEALQAADFNLDNVGDELKEILERYHEINREIQRQERALEDLATAKDRAFGSQRLQYIDDEINGYKNLVEQQKALAEAAEDFLEVDKAKIQKLFGNAVNFNDYGEITNYSELYQHATDDQREALEQYEETLDAVYDANETIKDSLNTIQDLNYEKLEYQLELKVDINEDKLKELDFLLTQYGDNFYKKAEALVATMDKVPMYDDMLKLYTNQIESLTSAYESGDISQADYTDGLKANRDSIYEQLEALVSLDQEMMTYYEDTLSAATEELSDFTDHMEHLTSVFDHYLSLMKLLGKETDYSSMGDFLSGKAETIRDRLDVAKEYQEVLQQQRIEAEKALARASDDEQKELLTKNLDAIIDELDAAEEEVLSMTEEYVEAMRAVIENNMNEIMANLEDALTKGLGFETLMDNFERLNTRQEEYLTKTNQIYETNKLMRTANKALDETDNKVSKQKLQNFIDETKAMQDQKILSEYELEVQQAKYDLLLAEIALEEAQAAKSTVRLSRDSEGNFGYVYTADQDAIDDAQQEVDDAQNRLYNLSLEGQETYLEKYLQTQQEANDALAELWNQYYNEHTLTEEEYWAARDQTETYYYQLLTGYQDLFTYATQVSTEAQQDYWVKGYDNILLKADMWRSTVHSYYDEIDEQVDAWRDLQETANSDVSGALDNSKLSTENLTKESENLKDMLEDEVIDAIENEVKKVRIQTEAYADQREELQGLIEDYKKYINLVNGTIESESGEANSSGATDYSYEMAKAYLAGDTNAIYSWGAFRSEKEENGEYTSATTSRLYKLFESASNGNQEAQQLIKDAANRKKYFTDETLKSVGIYNTGGYTGEWGPEGKLAFLHEKELVLNKDDTENMLKSISFIRQIVSAINSQASMASLFNLSSSGINPMNSTLEQNVHIEASFPNATNHSEIEEAFNNLVNRASQYANRK